MSPERYEQRYELGPTRGQGLVDVLDRILDKGLVIAGDIRINVANVELLTIRIRLLVCSVDKADEIGISWWRTDPYYTGRPLEGTQLPAGQVIERLDGLNEKLERVESRLQSLERDGPQ